MSIQHKLGVKDDEILNATSNLLEFKKKIRSMILNFFFKVCENYMAADHFYIIKNIGEYETFKKFWEKSAQEQKISDFEKWISINTPPIQLIFENQNKRIAAAFRLVKEIDFLLKDMK